MNNRGFAYLLALFCLVLVSAVAFLWHQQQQSFPQSVSDSWSKTIADQAAISGIEYGLALIKSGQSPSGTLRVVVPGGTCKLTFVTTDNDRRIRSEATVRVLGKVHKTILFSSYDNLIKRP